MTFTVKKTRAFPPEFTVSGPNFVAEFRGRNAEKAAHDYRDFKNGANAPKAEA